MDAVFKIKPTLYRGSFSLGQLVRHDGWNVYNSFLFDQPFRVKYDIIFNLWTDHDCIEISLSDIISGAGINCNVYTSIAKLLNDRYIDVTNATEDTLRYFGPYLPGYTYGGSDDAISFAEYYELLVNCSQMERTLDYWSEKSGDFPDDIKRIIFDYTEEFNHNFIETKADIHPHIIFSGNDEMLDEMLCRIRDNINVESIGFVNVIGYKYCTFRLNDRANNMYIRSDKKFESVGCYVIYIKILYKGTSHIFGLYKDPNSMKTKIVRSNGMIKAGFDTHSRTKGYNIITNDWVNIVKSLKGSVDDIKKIRLDEFIDHCRSKVYSN